MHLKIVNTHQGWLIHVLWFITEEEIIKVKDQHLHTELHAIISHLCVEQSAAEGWCSGFPWQHHWDLLMNVCGSSAVSQSGATVAVSWGLAFPPASSSSSAAHRYQKEGSSWQRGSLLRCWSGCSLSPYHTGKTHIRVLFHFIIFHTHI